jgi:hypothetical protein
MMVKMASSDELYVDNNSHQNYFGIKDKSEILGFLPWASILSSLFFKLNKNS